MESIKFPRTMVGGRSLPRMIIGTNWLLGYSHTGAAADSLIRNLHDGARSVSDVFIPCLQSGVDAVMGPILGAPLLDDAIRMAEDTVGRGMIRIDTPTLNVDDTAAGRREAEEKIAACKKLGADFCLIHHSSAEQLVNKNLRAMPRLPDYLRMIRDHDMIPGLSAHMPELVLYADANEYDVETYIQIFNCMGFLMQVEIESVHRIIWSAKKPVMTIKPMAAGRCTPFVGITFNYSVLRDCDMVTVGCLTPQEAREDIEIGMAAIERRPPVLAGRSSPCKTAIIR
ncbi:MAG: hypothetical protein GX549_08060 [Clostridiales bacterium]|nr:hypothetical protein [Clostridiales bacterium]